MNRCKIPVEKINIFINNLWLFLSAREHKIHHFKSKIFSIKNLDKISTTEPTPDPTVFNTPKPTKSEHKISPKFTSNLILFFDFIHNVYQGCGYLIHHLH